MVMKNGINMFLNMKKRAIVFLAVVSLACSCQKERSTEENSLVTEERQMEVFATFGDIASKTVIVDGTQVYWSPGDKINLFQGTLSSGEFSAQITEPSSKASFIGSLTTVIGSIEDPGTNEFFWGVYPYAESNICFGGGVSLSVPDSQTAFAGSFAPGMFPSISKSTTAQLAFYNVCGGVRFSVTKEGVKKVTIKGNNGEYLAGKVNVSMGADGKPVVEVVEGKKIVSLVCQDGFTVGQWYYISLLPGTLNNGFSMAFETDSQFACRKHSTSVDVTRSIFGSMQNVDESLTYQDIAVDLGLSVKWASFNLGAISPEDNGYYYQWGDTMGYGANTKDGKSFSWDSYKWCNGTENSLTKYNHRPACGIVDNKKVLEVEDDAASVALGATWRMPTYYETTELLDYCTWTWTTLNGVNGCKVQSKKAGYTDKWIFLPAVGLRCDSYLDEVGVLGNYWSSSLDWGAVSACYFAFSSESYCYNANLRYYGYAIRPVADKR